MKNSDLAALAAAAIARGATVTRVETGARAYDPREFYRDGRPISNAEKAEMDENAAYAAWEKAQQDAWARRFA